HHDKNSGGDDLTDAPKPDGVQYDYHFLNPFVAKCLLLDLPRDIMPEPSFPAFSHRRLPRHLLVYPTNLVGQNKPSTELERPQFAPCRRNVTATFARLAHSVAGAIT